MCIQFIAVVTSHHSFLDNGNTIHAWLIHVIDYIKLTS